MATQEQLNAIRARMGIKPPVNQEAVSIDNRRSELNDAWGEKQAPSLQDEVSTAGKDIYSGIKDSITSRRASIAETEKRYSEGKISLPNAFIQNAGQVVAGAFDIPASIIGGVVGLNIGKENKEKAKTAISGAISDISKPLSDELSSSVDEISIQADRIRSYSDKAREEAAKQTDPNKKAKLLKLATTFDKRAEGHTQSIQDITDELGDSQKLAEATTAIGGLYGGSKLPGVAGEAKTALNSLVREGGAIAEDTNSLITRSLAERRVASLTKEAAKVDDLTGKIVQGETSDIQSAKNALRDVDTTQIKTYDDLSSALNDKVAGLSSKLDKELAKSPVHNEPLKLADWDRTIKVGDEIVSHNYVDDAFRQLREHYSKINDVVNLKKIEQLMQKAEKEGITIQEVNDLAREHGNNLNAYNANGQLASGLTKQAVENTRRGLKSTAREAFGNDTFKEIDSAITDTIRTRDLVKDQVEAVNKLTQKIQPRSWGQEVGRWIAAAANTLGMNSPKGFVEYFLGRGTGLKTLNALDLEKQLQKNLINLQKALNATSEKDAISALKQLVDDQNGLPSSRENQSLPDANGRVTNQSTKPTAQQNTPNKNTTTMQPNMNDKITGTNNIISNTNVFVPQSKTGKYIMDYFRNPKMGLSIRELKINPRNLDRAIFDSLGELRDIVEKNPVETVGQRLKQVNLDDIEFLDGLDTQKIGDLTGEDRARFYEIAARHGREDIVETINKMVKEE